MSQCYKERKGPWPLAQTVLESLENTENRDLKSSTAHFFRSKLIHDRILFPCTKIKAKRQWDDFGGITFNKIWYNLLAILIFNTTTVSHWLYHIDFL